MVKPHLGSTPNLERTLRAGSVWGGASSASASGPLSWTSFILLAGSLFSLMDMVLLGVELELETLERHTKCRWTVVIELGGQRILQQSC